MRDYYNRFDPTQNYEHTLFLAGRGLQSAELNELQDYALSKIKGIGDALFRDGNVVRGCDCVIDTETGRVAVASGGIYLRGAVRDVAEAALTMPLEGRVHIGVWYQEATITELEDPALRDPAVGTRNYQECGAARLQVNLTWDVQMDGKAPDPNKGEFYPVHTVMNGVLIQQAPPPQLDSVSTALARYDRESNGSYVVKGLEVTCIVSGVDQQVFVINEGKAHVDGFEIELPHSLRVNFPTDPDVQLIQSDPYTFQPDTNGVMAVTLGHMPLQELQRVDGTAQKTVTLTHGSFTGSVDPLPDEAVLEIILVQQTTKTYVLGTDYKLSKGGVDWSLPGAEVAPGSSYTVTYRYRTRLVPTALTETGFSLSGAVPGTLVLLDYTWRLPRYDLITIDQHGWVNRIKGLSHPWRPSLPKAPAGQLALAYVVQHWGTADTPQIISNAIQAIPMRDLQAMRQSISDLYDLVAQECLKNDANARDPSAKKGLFVDPFFDDDMRDQGIPQSAAIVDRMLSLPITPTVVDLGKQSASWLLPYVLEPVLEQTLQTSNMKINPYQAFDPIPAQVTIILNVDRWTEVDTNWTSPITQRFSVYSSPMTTSIMIGAGLRTTTQSSSSQTVYLGTSVSDTSQLLSSQSQDATTMRSVPQTFTLQGFQPGEVLQIIFDGIPVDATLQKETK